MQQRYFFVQNLANRHCSLDSKVGSGEEELASSPYPYPSSAINRGGVVCPTLTPDSVISCGDVVGVPSSHDGESSVGGDGSSVGGVETMTVSAGSSGL